VDIAIEGDHHAELEGKLFRSGNENLSRKEIGKVAISRLENQLAKSTFLAL
jgi:hypothetical protein